MKTRKRVGDSTPPWGTPSLTLTCLLIIPSTLTLAVLLKRKSLSHLYILPYTPARSPSFKTLSKAFEMSKKTARTFFFSWKTSSVQCPASREPIDLRGFGTVDSLFVLELELSLTQDGM